jgi:hypothetical protein
LPTVPEAPAAHCACRPGHYWRFSTGTANSDLRRALDWMDFLVDGLDSPLLRLRNTPRLADGLLEASIFAPGGEFGIGRPFGLDSREPHRPPAGELIRESRDARVHDP